MNGALVGRMAIPGVVSTKALRPNLTINIKSPWSSKSKNPNIAFTHSPMHIG
jgi:hypothetical protein